MRTRLTAVAVAVAVVVVAAGAGNASPPDRTPPRISAVAVSNGGAPYAGDRRLLTTISPNGDGVRDRAAIRFGLSERAFVTLRLARTTERPVPVYSRSGWFDAGRHTLHWSPRRVNPRTYLVLLHAIDRAGHRAMYGARTAEAARKKRTAVIRVLGLDASFERASYRPGALAGLRIETDAPSVTVQLFRAGSEKVRTSGDNVMNGAPVGSPRAWTFRRTSRHKRVAVRIPDVPSGLLFAQLTAPDGRVGYAPFVLRPRTLGEKRIAVVMPTYTWQAYNFRDENGDGYGDTWYAGRRDEPVRLARAFLRRGVPPHYRAHELNFLRWLVWTKHAAEVETVADVDLERAGGGDRLASLYDLIVLPGHTEYVTGPLYRALTRYRNLGGNLVFLSANNLFWKVQRRGEYVRKVRRWRYLGRPEAALIGVQYRGNDLGGRQEPYVVRGAQRAPWLFEGTSLANGSYIAETYGFGTEIDAVAAASPRGTIVLAEIPNLYGPGFTAQMTYYETARGARVFAAGTLNFGGRATFQPVRRLLENLWARVASP